VYMVTDGWTQRVENPCGLRVVRDCDLFCLLGDVVVGMVGV